MREVILSFIIGALVGVVTLNWKYTGEQAQAALDRGAAEEVRNDEIAAMAKYYEDRIRELNDRAPDVRIERVFVKASCPVRTGEGGSASVGDEGAAGVAELAPATVQSLDRLVNKVELQYQTCQRTLSFWQDTARKLNYKIKP